MIRRRRESRSSGRRSLEIQTLEKRHLLAAELLETSLLQDLNPQAPASGASDFVAVGEKLFFVADDGLHGKELFVTNGDGAGVMVKDIAPGREDGGIGNLTAVNDTLFFTAYTPEHGEELWKSDGTEDGTVLVRDIDPTSVTYDYDGVPVTYGYSSYPHLLTAAADKLFFVADDGTHGAELWMSDGSAAGTVLVADVEPGQDSSLPNHITFAPAIGEGTVFFSAETSTIGRELWKSSLEGAFSLVANVFPETTSAGEPVFTEWTEDGSAPVIRNQSGRAIVGETDASDNWVFFDSDGTQVMPAQRYPFDSHPQDLVPFDGRLYFSATGVDLDGSAPGLSYQPVGRELWVTDGTAEGTYVADDLAAFDQVISVTDVTGATIQVRRPGGASSSPRDLVATDTHLFFSAIGQQIPQPVSGRELYARGSLAIPGGGQSELLKDIFPGANHSSPAEITRVGNRVFFTAENASGVELWKSDGTTVGTTMVRDIAPGSRDSDPESLTNLNGTLVFTADDGANGREVWKSDGTLEGTTMVKEIRPGGSFSNSLARDLTAFEGHVYFGASDFFRGFDVWRTDGTESGTNFVGVETIASISSDPKHLTRVGSTLYFVANSPEYGEELWKVDRFTIGARLVKDINPDFVGLVPQGSQVSDLVEFNGLLYFVASDQRGARLWKTDGTESGTTYASMNAAGGLIPGPAGPSELVVIGDKLFFTADQPDSGREVWALDAADGQPMLMKDIDPTVVVIGESDVALSSQPLYLTPFEDRLFFSAFSPESGRELWSSDGTPEGTQLVGDVDFEGDMTYSSDPSDLVVVGSRLFFLAEDPDHGFELRVLEEADGEIKLVTDLEPGSEDSSINSLVPFGQQLVFRRDDNYNDFLATNAGNELWISDGTAAGTGLIVDVEPGPEGSKCFGDYLGPGIAQFGDNIVFRANDVEHGCELFISDGTSEGTTLLADLFEDAVVIPDEEGESSDPDELTVIGDSLYFRATDESGRALWKLDSAGLLHRAALSDGYPPVPADFTVVGPNLYFTGSDEIKGIEVHSLELQPTLSTQVMEILARDVAYQDWNEGDSVSMQALGYGRFSVAEFTVDQFFQDPVTGFDAVGLVSDSLDPVLAIRGSVDFLTDWFDDFHPDGVGTAQFLANFGQVETWLNSVSASHGIPSVVGHSLGGGLTQLVAAQYTNNGGSLAQVVTFNAPAVNADYAEMFDAERAESVVHYVTNGDPVSMAGDAFLQGSWVRSTFSDLNPINNHILPVVVPFTFAGETRGSTRLRPADVEYEFFENTDWLSHPYYFHDDADYLTFVSVMYAVTAASETLKPYRHLPASLLFRSTAESQRQTIGQAWHEIQTPVLAAIGPTPCNPDHDPFVVSDIELNVLGILDVEATGLMASCQRSPDPTLWLQGELRLPEFFNVTANFTDENRIQLANQEIELVGTVTAEDIPIVPQFLVVKEAGIGINTIENTLEAGAQLDIKPWGVLLGVDLGFLNNQWNSIEIGLDDLDLPVPFLPGGFLQRISGNVDHIAASDPAPIAFGGSIGMTLGPEVNLDLPDWAGGPIEAKLLGFDGAASFDNQHLSVSADLSVLSDLATVNGTTEWNWVEGTLEATGGFDILNGTIVSDDASFIASVAGGGPLNVNASASATFSVPSVFPLIGGSEAFSGDFFFQFTDDSNLSNDSTGAYAGVDLPFVGETGLGFRLWFDGSFGLIGAETIEELGGAPEGEFPQSVSPLSRQVTVDADKQWVIFSAEWQNPTGTEIVLTTPGGQILTESDIASHTEMEIVSELSGATRRVVIISQPDAGTWEMSVDSPTDTGDIQYFAASSNVAPTGAITGVVGGDFGLSRLIDYQAFDSDNDAKVSFFYSSDDSGQDGVMIASGIVENDGPRRLVWDTTQVPEGDYFVYMVIDDHVNAPVTVYLQQSVSVKTPHIRGQVWNDLDANGIMDFGEPAVADVAVYSDANGNGVLDAGESAAVSDSDGFYRLNRLSSGSHAIRIVPAFGYVQSFPAMDQPQTIVLAAEGQVADADFGIRLAPSSVEGVVWQDRNRDGFRDDSEERRRAVTVRLISEADGTVVQEVETDSDGAYRFQGIVPGSYEIEVEMAVVDTITLQDRPGSDDYDSNLDPLTARTQVSLVTDEIAAAIDIGLFSTWNYFVDPHDVDANGDVTPRDALLVINYIALVQATNNPEQVVLPYDSSFPDVSGNSVVSPLDALLVINRIARDMAINSEGEPEIQADAVSQSSPVVTIASGLGVPSSRLSINASRAPDSFREENRLATQSVLSTGSEKQSPSSVRGDFPIRWGDDESTDLDRRDQVFQELEEALLDNLDIRSIF